MVNIVKMCALTNQDIFFKKLENFIILFAWFSIKIELLFVFYHSKLINRRGPRHLKEIIIHLLPLVKVLQTYALV